MPLNGKNCYGHLALTWVLSVITANKNLFHLFTSQVKETDVILTSALFISVEHLTSKCISSFMPFICNNKYSDGHKEANYFSIFADTFANIGFTK